MRIRRRSRRKPAAETSAVIPASRTHFALPPVTSCSSLTRTCAQNQYAWLCAPHLTLADLFWAVSLVRLKYLGLAKLWSDLPTIDAYLERLLELPSVQSEVLASTISSMPRSDYLAA
ncbi:hypothetical protein GOL69_17400 [Sinorhizobium medicae]|nr:hypothetical protein [Sinorhizobium medicae]